MVRLAEIIANFNENKYAIINHCPKNTSGSRTRKMGAKEYYLYRINKKGRRHKNKKIKIYKKSNKNK